MDEEAHEVYDGFAPTYADRNPGSPARAGYEWPAVRAVLPDVDGRRVLDAACGTGYYARWLADRGATVVGLDASRGMLEEANDDHGDVLDLAEADLRTDLPLVDDCVDLVVCQLALDHIEDWTPVFESFARVLAPGGALVLSIDHPFTTYFVIDHEPDDIGNAQATAADYYAVERFEKRWGSGDDAVTMPVYRRSLAAVTRPLFAAGFAVTDLREPRPTTDTEPLAYFDERTPRFLVVRAERP